MTAHTTAHTPGVRTHGVRTSSRHALRLVLIVILIMLYQPAMLFAGYMYALGPSFWWTAGPMVIVFLEVILWVITRKGVLHWAGIGLIALSPVLGVGIWVGFISDGVEEWWVRVKRRVRENLSEVGK